MRLFLTITTLVLVTHLQVTAEEPRPLLKESVRETSQGAFRDAPTDVAVARKTLSQMLAGHEPSPIKQRPVAESSLASSSIFLFDGTNCTIIPVGSILHLPAELQNRVAKGIQGNFVLWPEFLKLNKAWLLAQEVPLAMARGDSKAAEPILRSLSQESHAVVSVYRGGPISILEPSSNPPQSRAQTTRK